MMDFGTIPDIYAMIPKKDGSILTKEEVKNSYKVSYSIFYQIILKIGTDYKVQII